MEPPENDESNPGVSQSEKNGPNRLDKGQDEVQTPPTPPTTKNNESDGSGLSARERRSLGARGRGLSAKEGERSSRAQGRGLSAKEEGGSSDPQGSQLRAPSVCEEEKNVSNEVENDMSSQSSNESTYVPNPLTLIPRQILFGREVANDGIDSPPSAGGGGWSHRY